MTITLVWALIHVYESLGQYVTAAHADVARVGGSRDGGAPRARRLPDRAKQLAVARGTPKVDGRLDDAVWEHACFITDFEQKTPDYGAKPTHPMRVAVALDDDTLYVAARMWSNGPDDIDDALTERDVTDQAERFIVSLDPSHTRRIAYSFAVTARGRARRLDPHRRQRGQSRPVVGSGVGREDRALAGWLVGGDGDSAVAAAACRASPRRAGASTSIGICRAATRTCSGARCRKIAQAWASYFGELVDLPPVHPGVNLELLPYASIARARSTKPRRRRRRIARSPASKPASTRSCVPCPAS